MRIHDTLLLWAALLTSATGATTNYWPDNLDVPCMSTPAPLKFLFVINPVSGGNAKEDCESTIRKYFRSSPHAIETFVLDGKNDAGSLDYWIERIKPDRVVAVGGDGTVNLVGKKLMGTEMVMGIIAAGSANGLATELKIPSDTEEALQIITSEKVREIDIVRVNDRHISLHLADIGLNAQLVKYYEESSWRGKLGYAKVLLKTLWNKQQIRVMIELGDQRIERHAFMVVLANSRTYGTGAVINPDGDMSDGKFEVVVIRKLALSELLKMILFHRPFNPKKIEIFQTTSAVIHTRKKTYLQADGEYLGKENHIRVAMAREKLKLLVS